MKTIESLHLAKTGKVSDKWASYLKYYDALFQSRRDQEISLLEIGVQNGGSLETWAEYFEFAKILVGCDIDPKCGSLAYDDPRVRVVVGDANSQSAFNEINAVCPSFDVIIDDGSHISTDIINSFINYFPMLKPGGLYVVEDTHTLYGDSCGGGILNEYDAYAFFKRLIDVVNFQFWRNELDARVYLSTFFARTAVPTFILDGWVDSLEFRNSIITIRKADNPGHEKLGKRIVVGQSAQVQTWGAGLSR